MRRTGWTLRRRLTAGLLVLLAALIAGVGATEALVLRHELYSRTATGLRTELALLTASSTPAPQQGPGSATATSNGCASLGGQKAPPLARGPRGPKGRSLGPGKAGDLVQILAERGVATAVIDADGTLLACAQASVAGTGRNLGVPVGALDAIARAGRAGSYATFQADGRHLLAVEAPIGTDTAVMVTDLAGDDAALQTVILVTVVGGLVALAVAGLAARPLLRSGLAPLTKVARTADAVAAGRIDQRADLERSPDEVGRLGVAFDRMVDRLGASLAERDALVCRLRASEGTMRRFLADASHELRTPLTAIRGGIQVLRLGAADDPADLREVLGHLQSQTERMSRLVSDLLALSYSDANAPRPVLRPVDLGTLIAAERSHLSTLAPDHPIRVDADPALVHADADAVVRLVANLVDNAAKYSPPNAPIEIAVRAIGARGQLAVSDHGPGIPAPERPKVFERFYRGDPARARSAGGNGLGLAIVAAIAAQHGGTARAEDATGGGARIVVELPLAPAGAPAAGDDLSVNLGGSAR